MPSEAYISQRVLELEEAAQRQKQGMQHIIAKQELCIAKLESEVESNNKFMEKREDDFGKVLDMFTSVIDMIFELLTDHTSVRRSSLGKDKTDMLEAFQSGDVELVKIKLDSIKSSWETSLNSRSPPARFSQLLSNSALEEAQSLSALKAEDIRHPNAATHKVQTSSDGAAPVRSACVCSQVVERIIQQRMDQLKSSLEKKISDAAQGSRFDAAHLKVPQRAELQDMLTKHTEALEQFIESQMGRLSLDVKRLARTSVQQRKDEVETLRSDVEKSDRRAADHLTDMEDRQLILLRSIQAIERQRGHSRK
ncbi:hypothetical protein KVT40_009220 [Elsinoe batatas]|uniref:Uncharacterized protein n=1 Tax=Elsinoe batatas TaxID=2601811 RepID=A0A8K0PDB6_9PEZI|nr:hypothetical protein KVT40_009220 [Elsinoe batatas]